MANHEIFKNTDRPTHVNHQPATLVIVEGTHTDDHDASGQKKYLTHSLAQPQQHLAQKGHDTEAHFSKIDPPMSESKAFKEVFTNTPKTVDRSKSEEGQRKQKIAIALSKA